MISVIDSTHAGKVIGPEDLRERTKQFALRVITLFRALPKSEEARVLGKQILRSGTSVASNDRSACRARSRADFISKIGIVVEEADETAFWLELLIDAGILGKPRLQELLAEANELVRIFAASRATARNHQSQIANHQ